MVIYSIYLYVKVYVYGSYITRSTEANTKDYNDRQKEINASKMQFDNRAEQVAYYLYEEIRDYQNKLPDTEDVAMSVVQFNQSITILVKEIGYIGYNLVCFHGEETSGKPLGLIQHVQQLNFLLMVVPKPEPRVPKRQIGFVGSVEERV